MKKHLFIFLLPLLLGSCVSSAPLNNLPFSTVTSIEQFLGKYKNKGEGGNDSAQAIYLSKILWPNDSSFDHQLIEVIEVKRHSQETLLVNGLANNQILKTKLFTYNKDFKIVDGVINLKNEAGVAGFKSGEPMLGIYTQSSKIGLDEKGHGKFQSHGAATGLAFMFLPIAISDSSNVRFNRIE